MFTEKGRIKLWSYPFQNHTLKIFGSLHHARFSGITLYMLYLRIFGKNGDNAIIHHHRTCFIGTCSIRIRNLNVRTKTYDFTTHFALEPHNHRHRNNHHRQPDSNTYQGNEHGRT